ncbi:MAG: InlB B-repeat-containing protein, partial [Clostridia bacterium]|nr:InlB B-repeat-containing protein [Clostridia bacterium]
DYGGEGGLHNYSKSTDGTYLGRTGYTATGNWNTKADGTGISVSQYTAFSSLNTLASALGKNVTNGNASVNLYPEWTINTYTVSYNANGGSGAPASQSKIYGTNLTLTSSKPTRTNYTFKNWNTKADGSGTSYISGGTYSTNAAVTLYAQWMLNSYTLSYNTNGGIGTPASQTGNGSITLSSTKPTKSGYTFQGWATSASATSAQYQPGATFNLATNTTLYAVWKQDPVTPTTFTLTYDANNGTGAPASQTGNDQITLSTAKPSRSGYTFLGWATSANATSAQYQPGATFNLTANTTLYAVWQKNDMPVTPSNPTASAKLKVKSSTTVDYRSKVNITAMASGVPDGYVLAIYEGKVLKEKGTKDKVTYTPVDGSGKPVELTGDKTFTVKVIDAKGNVQKDGNGKDLTAKVEIKVKSGFFDKLIAFFKGLFGLLPTVDIKP